MRRAMGSAVFVVVTALGAAGCTFDLPERECNVSSECLHGGVPGECVASPTSAATWCAFPSGNCPSGLEYGILAGDDLAGTCVAVGGDADADVDAEVPDAGIDAMPDACVPATETCDGVDNDCDGSTDEGCPAQVEARFPWNGYATGSIFATSAGLGVKPRRPIFRWEAVTGATSYRLQVDDSCTTPDFATCDFATPEFDNTVTGTSASVGADLPVSLTPPVGTRYYWRVRACNDVGCGLPSAVRYLDVGRLPSDYNGDGYGDFAAGSEGNDANGAGAGAVYICFGGPTPALDCAVSVTLLGATAGDGFAWPSAAGDVNADGYADLLVGAKGSDAAGIEFGAAYLFLGGSTFDTTADVTYVGDETYDYFGAARGAGDFNGDGYRDVAIGAPQSGLGGPLGRVIVYFGAPLASIDATPDATITGETDDDGFGYALAVPGDVNGDGFPDLLVGAPNYDGFAAGGLDGRAYLYLGGAGASFDTTADWSVTGSRAAVLGLSTGGCDVNSDGFSDVLVGEPSATDGRVYVYNGGASIDMTSDATLSGTSGAAESYGHSIGCTDMNADGFADIVAGAWFYDGVGPNQGRAQVFFGGSGVFDTTPDGTFTGEAAGDRFGDDAGAVGDVNGDGYGDITLGAYVHDVIVSGDDRGRAYVFFGGAGTSADTTTDMRISGIADSDACGRGAGGGAF
jgi:hypothetical protein